MAEKRVQLLRALDAHDKPMLLVDCGPDGAWRVVFANAAAGKRAGATPVQRLMGHPEELFVPPCPACLQWGASSFLIVMAGR